MNLRPPKVYAILTPGPFRESDKPGPTAGPFPGVPRTYPRTLDPTRATLVVKNADRFAVRVFAAVNGWRLFRPLPAGASIGLP